MKRVFITSATSVLFIAVFIYVTRTLSPWNSNALLNMLELHGVKTNTAFLAFIDDIIQLGLIWEVLSLRNLVIWLILMGAAVVSSVASIHLFIDKLFFRKFYEEANVYNAIRRGVLVYTFFIYVIFLNLVSGLYWYSFVLILILLIAVELIVMNSISSKGGKDIVEKEESKGQ